jgi:hypothetical protein
MSQHLAIVRRRQTQQRHARSLAIPAAHKNNNEIHKNKTNNKEQQLGQDNIVLTSSLTVISMPHSKNTLM